MYALSLKFKEMYNRVEQALEAASVAVPNNTQQFTGTACAAHIGMDGMRIEKEPRQKRRICI
jgi:hypothetical protein